jgi:hypothetical protein
LRPSRISDSGETCPGLGLEDADEIDRLDDVAILGLFGVRKLSLIAFLSEFINVRLNVRLCAQMNKGTRHLGRQALRDRVQQSVYHWRRLLRTHERNISKIPIL